MSAATASQGVIEGVAARAAGAASRAAGVKAAPPFRSADEFRAALDHALRSLEADERAAVALRAAGLRLRLSCPDIGATLDVVAEDDPEQHLRWSFGGEGAIEDGLALSMDSSTANGYLQGSENLAIAIARGRVRCRGGAWAALVCLPAAGLIAPHYRRAIEADHRHLLAT